MSGRVAVIGAGIVGSATALALARRSVQVIVLEAESEPGLAASGTNSGILHTGFDSAPGELETKLILRGAALRGAVFEALGIPIKRCGARMRPRDDAEREAVTSLARNADANGVEVHLDDDGVLVVPGEAVTDPVVATLALAAAAERHGAAVRPGVEVTGIDGTGTGLRLAGSDGGATECDFAVNCAGLGAGAVARMAGDDSFEIYPRKGEFLVFEQREQPLEEILLPVPTKRTKGVLVFPTLDGKVVAGPTAVDQDDPDDWSVRDEAATEILPKAIAMYPPLGGSEPVFAYAGLRPAGRGSNYVIAPSPAEPRLIHAAAIRSTGLTASLGIAERIAELAAEAGVDLGSEADLLPGPAPVSEGPWWRRTAVYRDEKGDSG
jgi:glycerol-3-phosphate dehydrogenase